MKKGISLVALIITIIVLIILTAAVVMTGVNTPQNAQLAVFYNNVTNVQEAITLKIMDNMSKYADSIYVERYKWEDVLDGYDPLVGEPDFASQTHSINDTKIWRINEAMEKYLSISRDEMYKYYVSEKGVVYYYNNGVGFLADNGVTYYNRTEIGEANSEEEIVITATNKPIHVKEAYYTMSPTQITLNVDAFEIEDFAYEPVLVQSVGASYGFTTNGSLYESTNCDYGIGVLYYDGQGPDTTGIYNDTVAESYTEIDLTSYDPSEVFIITADCQASSEQYPSLNPEFDYGYVLLNNSTEYIIHRYSENALMFSKDETKQYMKYMYGGQKYYLHMGYSKNSEYYQGLDKAMVSNIQIKRKVFSTLGYRYYIDEQNPVEGRSVKAIDVNTSDFLGSDEVEGVSPQIPVGFKHVEGEIDSGYVISDGEIHNVDIEIYNNEFTEDTSIYVAGNEFVWIPVNDTSTMYTTLPEENNRKIGILHRSLLPDYGYYYIFNKTNPLPYSSTAVREPDVTTATYDSDLCAEGLALINQYFGINTDVQVNYKNYLQADFDAMTESVELNGGFYVGRYETSKDQYGNLQVKKNQKPYIMQSYYEMHKIQKDFSEGSSYIGSGLIWGCQWDQIVLWMDSVGIDISDSTSYGNYYNASVTANDGTTVIKPANTAQGLNTGVTDYTKVNNIYDLAGNYMEITLEAFNTNQRVTRGGYYYNSGATIPIAELAEYFFCTATGDEYSVCGRMYLYLK